MPALFVVAGLVVLLTFTFGVLVGHSATEQWFAQRSRRQAAMQFDLNEQLRALEASWVAANLLFREIHSGNSRSRACAICHHDSLQEPRGPTR